MGGVSGRGGRGSVCGRERIECGSRSVWSAGVGYCGGAEAIWRTRVSGVASGGGRVLRAIMRNFFGYAVISAVLKRKRLLICNSRKVAKTELYNEW